MASTASSGLDLSGVIKPRTIKTTVLKLPWTSGFNADLAVGFEGLSQSEVMSLIAFAIKIEQARTVNIEINVEVEPVRGNRFDNLDLPEPRGDRGK